ncbi:MULTISPECIES: hypothetical protein [unclassified Pedobacter]|uniref:hypothetical protein n=1 Tax=unclassified Pedobacter TaxID=2628915 RepID=UPI001421ACD0|nr:MULTISPECIES: hypothetical protein [unclassified Pedobacter]NII85631.1 hypothetical protein [Pedobacter sp. SG908]NMN39452.1 hypothetical protein [Pedobacter sp. SG918]
MKAIKVLSIALLAMFTFATVNAQTAAPVKPTTEKSQTKKSHKKHHHKTHTKKVTKV